MGNKSKKYHSEIETAGKITETISLSFTRVNMVVYKFIKEKGSFRDPQWPLIRRSHLRRNWQKLASK